MANRNPRKQPDLCCPACAYNLTGSCTLETPTGNCPECGLAYVRDALIEQRRRLQALYSAGFLIKLLGMPCLLAFLPLCCGFGAAGLNGGGVQVGSAQPLWVFVTLMVPLIGVLFAGWLLAYQYRYATTLGVPLEHRRGMQRHIILPWVLFFFVELLLTLVYLAVGGGIVMGILTSIGV